MSLKSRLIGSLLSVSAFVYLAVQTAMEGRFGSMASSILGGIVIGALVFFILSVYNQKNISPKKE
jgi:lipopolysaccharide export LptBFGC system permease protein LptF